MTGDSLPPPVFSAAELERRRSAARRLGWLLGGIVLALYLIGLLIER
jgi:hypothetical protein